MFKKGLILATVLGGVVAVTTAKYLKEKFEEAEAEKALLKEGASGEEVNLTSEIDSNDYEEIEDDLQEQTTETEEDKTE